MKPVNTEKKFSSFLSSPVLAGIAALLILGAVWHICRSDSRDTADTALLAMELGSGMDAEHAGYPVYSSSVDARASLGIGMHWMKELLPGKDSPCFDDSLKAFLAEKEKVCIPSYTDPVPWEDDPRYTVQDSGCGTQVFRTKIKSGDSIGVLLRPWLESKEQQQAVKAISSVFKISRLRIGRPFSVEKSTEKGSVSRIMYDIDGDSRLTVYREKEGFKAAVDDYQYDISIVRVSGEVKSSLFDAMTDAGENSALALQLAEVFSHQVDFVNDVQEGDSFDVVVEKKFLEGQFRSYGDIVAARFSNDGIVYEAFRFFDDEGVPHYYAADGSSLETQFLKAPLNFTRISSKYSMHRRHPVLGKVRPHQGVDYAAPRGTPVKALGEGVVTFVGWKRGYGKSVAVQHSGGVETHYAHLSRYAKGLSRGKKLEQGQVLGYVGSTGIATGPHLDFRVKKNGKFIDPLKLKGGKGTAIPAEQKELFENQMKQARLLLDGEAILAVR